MESVALMTKAIGIVTPLIPKYHSSGGSEIDIVQKQAARSNRTRKQTRFISYMETDQIHIVHGLWCEEEKEKEKRQSDVSV